MAERRMDGARYKVPRLVREEVASRPSFRSTVQGLARESGRAEADVMREALGYVKEIAAGHSPFVIDQVHRLIRAAWSQGYRALRYDKAQLSRLAALGERHPLAFLPSHKSNLDHAVMQYVLHENGHPPNHTAGGINMNFFPIGPLFRRTGVFFIRRTFKDNAVYKAVLRQYLDFLVEKRFPLEWYMEGGRSRSGKLLPPRLGLLSYVVDSFRRGQSADVILIPVSIAYDQISDVEGYAAEARGAPKEKESLPWLLRMMRGLRRSYGEIHIRFGEPVSLVAFFSRHEALANAVSDDEKSVAVSKLAFEVAVRINRVTPITPTSLVTLALLGRADQAMTVEETVKALADLVAYVRRKGLPVTAPIELDTREGVERALRQLEANGVVAAFTEGPEPVWAIGPGQHLAAAYYRNTVIHFFVTGAIGELALLKALESSDPVTVFREECLRLRDLLKFEFFFAEKEDFHRELEQELAFHAPDWKSKLARGGEDIRDVLRSIKPFSAPCTLRPFVEAYAVVADALVRADGPLEEGPFLAQCLSLGRQYLRQRRIRSAESVSKVLFSTGWKLAANRKLLAPGSTDRRKVFAAELKDVIRRIDAIDALEAERRACLLE